MSFREQFRSFKGRLKGAFERGSSPAPSTRSLPVAQIVSPGISPIVDSAGGGGTTFAQSPSSPPPHLQVTAPSIHSAPKSPGGSGDNPAQSTCSLPEQVTPSKLNSRPASLIGLTASDPVARPASAPPGAGAFGITGTWPRLNGFLQALDQHSDMFGPLKPVIDGFYWCIEMYEDAATAQEDYVALRAKLEGLFSDLSTHFSGNIPPTMTAGMNNLCTAIENELDRISSKEDRQAGRRYLEAKKDVKDVMDCYGRIHDHLERLRLNADLSMWKIVDKQATETLLKSLTPSMSACYNSAEATQVGRRECTPRTREQVLIDLGIWRHDKNQGNMYWLNGMAGTGKTTIANSLCAMLDRSHELGASFFCTRQLPECRNVKLILPSIAYQLARFSRPFYSALSQALQEDPDLHTKALPLQLQGLLVGPLRKVTHALPTDLVVVIDALDECEDIKEVALILEQLAKYASELPLKVFVSSRPEPEIREKIGDTKSKLILHDLEKSVVQEDIETYLRSELADMSLPDSKLKALVERAGVLFIYAATAIRYIKAKKLQRDRRHRLEVVLGAVAIAPTMSNRNKEIDALYTAVLTSAFGNPDLEDIDKEQMKLVLDTVICAQEPLTVDALAGLLRLEHAECVHSALEPLWSVLHVSGADSLVTTLHASFPDYMLDPTRSNEHSCNLETHHGRLAELCFGRIERNERQFNICGLESSFLLDDKVVDLERRVKEAIALDLAYACRYWAVHLELGEHTTERLQLLEVFCSKRLLLWMEVLNLKKQIDVAAILLKKARGWCLKGNVLQETHELLHDAWRFVTMFATNPVSCSTPHIYASMLASWPRTGPIADHYIGRSRGLAQVEGTGMAMRELALLGVFPVEREVNSVAFSPDGMRIVSGSNDNTVRLWDAQSGKPVLDPLKGHTGGVGSVAFSPNGMCIVSGSYDKTVRLWDAQSGKPVLDPLEGHSSSVTSVAFSPDGMRIVSGAYDNTVRLWDVQSGKPVLDPLEGHSESVNSVAFSPDGMRIVSGSYDKTVRLWDAQSGKPVLDPLEGHSEGVTSVAFSPDGMLIVSGSNDKTVRLWDVQSGKPVLDPLEGHTYAINAVAFSPDGIHIVSGSYDCTVRLWDALTGKPVLDPLTGHTSLVICVAFSPDGMRIISGSNDYTVRLWDAQIRQTMIRPDSLKGHTDWITCAAFSPDGMYIVSGSDDNTVRLWDAQSGKSVLEPLKGHSDIVKSVAFSPDGMRIVSGSSDSTVRLWDAQSGKPALGPLKGHSSGIFSVSFSPDGMRIVSGSSDSTVRLWDAQSGEPVLDPLVVDPYNIYSVSFSPDGMRIVSGCSNRTVHLWDAQSGKLVLDPLKGHSEGVTSVAFSPDGMLIVSGSNDKTVRLWDAQSGKPVLDPLEGHSESVNSVAFSPDGLYIVSGSSDHTVRLWDAQTGKSLLEPYRGHTGSVNSVAFSSDGMHVVSGSNDNVIRMWHPHCLTSEPVPTLSKAMYSPRDQIHSSLHEQPSSPTIQHSWSSVSWLVDEHGFVLDELGHMLLWIPPDLRSHLLTQDTSFLISTHGSVQLNFEHALLGESWFECYAPA